MKGLIIAAGYGTRFLPVTKTIPKEMLPILTKPSIAFIIEEFIAAGITDIILLSSRRKKVLEDYFDREIELETLFAAEKNADKLDKIRPYDINLSIIRQKEMLGTGHALLQAQTAIGDEPFVTAYPDDIVIGDNPLSRQLIELYEKTGCSVMAAIHNPPNLERYGVLELADDNFHVKGIVEKPAPGTEPSRKATIGRYLYTPEIFKYLQDGWEKHTGGEYYHIYALQQLMNRQKVVYTTVEGTRMDTGTPEGYLRAIIASAKLDPALNQVLREELSR
ncbi:MAG: UTP--glucose-1-phosphate uridylyltransferase [Spirochaetales bacterium]|nr:UTP--glucose-1-phosphate uridylyltransferase [Spirochaetales bacterium]